MDIRIRNTTPEDHKLIVAAMPRWWGGRDLSSSLLKIFFIHFQNTCFIAEDDHEFVGFLIGFISQSYKNEGYIHLSGTNPDYRRLGIGKKLYKKFFSVCQHNSVSLVKACTSPVNKLSIAFHQGMGFEILAGESTVNEFEVTRNYLSEGHDKVLFQIEI